MDKAYRAVVWITMLTLLGFGGWFIVEIINDLIFASSELFTYI